MTRGRGSRARWRRSALIVLVAALLAGTTTTLAPASAATSTPTTYRDFYYGPSDVRPTRDKPQSKLWHQDGAWWALMLNPADNKVHVFELLPDHTWRPTSAVVDDRPTSTGDALWDRAASKLYVASRQASTGMRFLRLSYDSSTRDYRVDSGFPVAVPASGSESAALDRDSLGRLWITYTRSSRVWVTHSTSSLASWVTPFSPPVSDTSVSSDDISSLISFNGQIGVMWSNQVTNSFRFAVHRDTDPDTVWSSETPLAGTALADDHINLKSLTDDSTGRIYAAVKTSKGDDPADLPSDPLVLVLSRSANGAWSSAVAGTVADDHSRPMLLLDETNQDLYFFATAPVSDGVIYYKRAPLSNVSFAPGRGDPFVKWAGKYVNDATGSKHPVNSSTGIVVLASSGGTDDYYYHAEMSLPGALPPGDTQPPTVPSGLGATATGPTSVSLSWSPASDNVGVTGYGIYRDGIRIATTASASYQDTTVTPGTTYAYAVDAFDAAGNTSARTAVVSVTTPSTPPASGSIAFRTASSAANNTATTLTIGRPAGTATGDALVATVDVRGRPTITAPAGWQLVRSTDNASVMRKATYVRIAGGAEPASYTWTFSSAQSSAGAVLAYSGVSTSNPVDTSGGQANAASTTITAPSVTTVSGGTVLVGLFSTAALTAITPPTTMTERSEAGATSGYRVTSETADVSRAGAGATGTFAARAGSATANIGHLVALRPAS